MGGSHIPDMDSSSNSSDDNPFTGPKAPVPGKVLVQMQTEDWLSKKLSKLNVTSVEGYPSRSSGASGLNSQAKWYGLFSDQKFDPSAVSFWDTGASKVNNSYSRNSRQTGLFSTPPTSRRISQETQ